MAELIALMISSSIAALWFTIVFFIVSGLGLILGLIVLFYVIKTLRLLSKFLEIKVERGY